MKDMNTRKLLKFSFSKLRYALLKTELQNNISTVDNFARKHDVFTCENNMLSSHVKISLLLWLHNKLHL